MQFEGMDLLVTFNLFIYLFFKIFSKVWGLRLAMVKKNQLVD